MSILNIFQRPDPRLTNGTGDHESDESYPEAEVSLQATAVKPARDAWIDLLNGG